MDPIEDDLIDESSSDKNEKSRTSGLQVDEGKNTFIESNVVERCRLMFSYVIMVICCD